MTRRPLRVLLGTTLALVALVLVNPAAAQASAAKTVTPTLSFSGSGSTMTITTKAVFKSGYNGAYYLSWDVYRSLSSTKSSPTKVNTTTLTATFSTTTSGSSYTAGPFTKNCPASSAKTAYYYWMTGTVSDGGTGKLAIITTPVKAVGCTSFY